MTSGASGRILVIDDHESLAMLVSVSLRQAGYQTEQATTYAEAERLLDAGKYDLVVSDVALDGGRTGLELLRAVRDRKSAVPFVLMTGCADIDVAVEATRGGVMDCLAKPVDLTRLLVTVRRALRGPGRAIAAMRAGVHAGPRIVGVSQPIVEVYLGVGRAATSDSPVLVTGPEGAGKELVAGEVHQRSSRASGPYRVVSGALEDFAKELEAAVAAAADGTVVVRRIDALDGAAQLRLAETVEAGPARFVGTARGSPWSLKPELLYSLAAVQIAMPSLRERMSDLPLLVEDLLRGIERRARKALRVTEDALALFAEHAWRANVRELQSVLESAGIAAPDGVIGGEEARAALASASSARAMCVSCGKVSVPGRSGGTCDDCSNRQAEALARARGEAGDAGDMPRFAGNRYLPYKQLAKGESTEVWLAWQPGLSRRVVVKVLRSTAPEDVERFKREARVHASLRHPRIPAVYDAGADETNPGQLHIVMEHINSVPLDARVRAIEDARGEPDLTRAIVRLMADACAVVGYLHGRGIVHRDIKPQNVIVTRRDVVYLIDYGLACPVEAAGGMTATGLVQGTIPFMSPEHVGGAPEALNARSDVWSLGATLYSLLTRTLPFGTGNFDEVAGRIRTMEPVPPRSANPHVSPALERVVLRALEKRASMRFANARELSDALRATQGAEAPAADAAPQD